MAINGTRPASEKQLAFIRRLADEKNTDSLANGGAGGTSAWDTMFDVLGNHTPFDPEHDKFVSFREASGAIDWLLSLPRKPQAAPVVDGKPSGQALTPGVFKRGEHVYVVKANRAKTSVYASELVEAPARMTQAGTEIPFELEYRPGVVATLTEDDRWALADAEQVLTRYSRCICCGRHLKAAASVRQAIGPVCIKMFKAA